MSYPIPSYSDDEDYLPQVSEEDFLDDQVIPSEDELELQREEDKWKRFFNAPDSDFKFPHAIHKAEVTRLLKEGLKINAIKYVRQVSGKGLAKAKDWVEAYQKMEGL